MIYILSAASVLSFCLLGVSVWYIRNLLGYSRSLIVDFIEINKNLKSFTEHVEKVYSMDRFYGDGTLESLLEHAKEINTELGDFISQKNDLFEDEEHEKEEKQ